MYEVCIAIFCLLCSEGKIVNLHPPLESDTKKQRPFYSKRKWFSRVKPLRSWEQQPGDGVQESSDNQTNNGETSNEGNSEVTVKIRQKNRKPQNRGGRQGHNPKENEDNENIPPKVKKPKKSQDGYSLCVSNIEKTVRVSDLKMALREQGIRPNFIVWKGYKGFCYLHYIKKKNPQYQESFAIDNVIEKIQAIKINPTEDVNLDVKVMNPITRIETVNVTSV